MSSGRHDGVQVGHHHTVDVRSDHREDETVVFDGVNRVEGLTRHNACVEKGDSGGSNVSVTDVYAAEGVSSGARLVSDGWRPRCLSAFGLAEPVVDFLIADSLSYYGGPTQFNVSLWR